MEDFPPPVSPQPEPKKRSGCLRTLVDILETILISVLIFLGINAITARIRVDSFSMEPTLYKGDYVIVNKLAYKYGSIARGDIIVFKFPPHPQEQYIKRVIGLPGDVVKIAGGQVYVNGEQLSEPYLTVPTRRGGQWEVVEDSLFVMGDNRNNSSDSREWGLVPLENVVGKALAVYWPPEQWRVLGARVVSAAQP